MWETTVPMMTTSVRIATRNSQKRAADILESGVHEADDESEELQGLRAECEALAFNYEM